MLSFGLGCISPYSSVYQILLWADIYAPSTTPEIQGGKLLLSHTVFFICMVNFHATLLQQIKF